MTPLSLDRQDGLAILTLDTALLDAAARGALMTAVETLGENPELGALVIRSARPGLPSLAAEGAAPPLWQLCDRIESCPRPVVIALAGPVLGPGLELALAAHGRVAAADTRLGFPEVTQGLGLAAGGTQRLPRLVGAEAALRLLTGGRPIRAADALAIGLLDRVVDADPLAAARARALELAAAGLPMPARDRRDGFRDPVAYSAAVAATRRAARHPHLPAAARLVDCVEAALLLPPAAGFTFERAAAEDLAASPAARGLHYARSIERTAPLPAAAPRPLSTVGLAGLGPDGTALVLALLAAGLSVILVDPDRNRLIAALESVAFAQEAAVSQGMLSPEQRDADWVRLAGRLDPEALAGADLVLDRGAPGLGTLAPRLRPGAVLALADPAGLGPDAPRAADTLALHLPPLPLGARLIEIAAGAATDPAALATAAALARRLKRLPVIGRGAFAGATVQAAALAAAEVTLLQGGTPATLDAALRAWGAAQGPCALADMAGLAGAASPLSGHLATAGRLGVATGAGWLAWPPGRPEGQDDPVVVNFLTAARAGRPPRVLPPAVIVRRVLLAMIAVGARLLQAGEVARPADIDLAMIAGYGFPRWGGGPMLQADLAGLVQVRKDLAQLATEDPLWAPPDLLLDLIKNGRGFGDLNG